MKLWQIYFKNTYALIDTLKQTKDKNISILYNRRSKQFCIMKQQEESLVEIYKLIQSINDPHIPMIYRVFCSDGQCMVVEEYIAGQTLAQILNNGRTFNEEEIISILQQLCDCLYVLHKNNIIHRDLTPSNIILTNEKIVKIIDFDIARQMKDDQDTDTKCLGTRGFAAPEQYGFGQTDARTDIYALGKTLEALNPKSIVMRRIIEKATRFSPKDRYQNVGEILAILSSKEYFNMLNNIMKLLSRVKLVNLPFTKKSKIDDKAVQEFIHEHLISFKPVLPQYIPPGIIKDGTTDYPFRTKVTDLDKMLRFPGEYQYIYKTEEEAHEAGIDSFGEHVFPKLPEYILQALTLFKEDQLKNYYTYEISKTNYYHKVNREVEQRIGYIFTWLQQNGISIDKVPQKIMEFSHVPNFDTENIEGSHLWKLKHFEELDYVGKIYEKILDLRISVPYSDYIKTENQFSKFLEKVSEDADENDPKTYEIVEDKRYAFNLSKAAEEMLSDVIWASNYIIVISDELRLDIQGAIKDSYIKNLPEALRAKANEIIEYIRPYLKK